MVEPERRKFPRKPKKFLIKFRVIGGPPRADIADRVGQIINVSQSGVLLVSKRELPPATIVELKIPENALGGGARTLQGIVRRIKPEVSAGDFHLGMAFVRVAKPQAAPAPAPAAEEDGERRRGTRTAQRLLLKLRGVSSGLFDEVNTRGGILLNVSNDGMEISTTRDYAPGTSLEVQIPESPLGPPRKVLTKVAWRGPSDEKPGHYRLGLAIVRR